MGAHLLSGLLVLLVLVVAPLVLAGIDEHLDRRRADERLARFDRATERNRWLAAAEYARRTAEPVHRTAETARRAS